MVSARIADASSASHDLSHCCSGTQRVAKPRRVALFDSIYTAAVLLCDQQEELKRSAVIAYQRAIAVAAWLDILRAGSLEPGGGSPMDLPSISEQADHPNISTGHLPEPDSAETGVRSAPAFQVEH